MKKDHVFFKNKNPNNKEIAELLRSVAAAYLIKDEDKHKFQIIAYERAADSIEHSSSEVKDLWDEGKLSELSGIGEAIASHLNELFSKGEVRHFRKVFEGLPPAMFPLLKIPNIGPKTAFKLARKLKIDKPSSAIVLLEKAAREGRIRGIEGFGKESEEKIFKGIKEFTDRTTRMPLNAAVEISNQIIDYLIKCPQVIRADPLGSLRRKSATVGDIDISVATNSPEKVIEYFGKYPKKSRILESGEKTASLLLKNNRQVDLMIQPPKTYGALLQHFTGSKHHNIKLREFALKKGLSLSEYGIRRIGKRQKLITFDSEEKFYNFLGMQWIPPELRENTGEIEASIKGELPDLVTTSQIKGDLHLHSNFPIEPSHDLGESSMRVMIEKAISLGYQYLAFSEHNPSASQHSSEQVIDLIKAKKQIIENFKCSRTNKLPIMVFNSLEIDIKPDGLLALPEKAFEFIDFAIASIHSSFDMGKKEMTERVIKGISHPKVKILGHPTGRKFNKREGYELEWERIFKFCREKNKFLEISSSPERLDLPDFLVREAVKNQVKMVISSDSHCVEQMDFISYGVSVAQRGWAEKKDILNTLPYKNFSDILLK